MNKESIFKKITDVTDIVEVIGQYIKLDKKGQNYFGLCPFHGDTNPSLSVSKSKKIFKCFVCDEKGNAITFVSKFKKISYYDAALLIAKDFNLPPNLLKELSIAKGPLDKFQEIYDINEQAADIYYKTLMNKENKQLLDYLLLKRKLTIDIIKEYKIGYTSKNNSHDYLLSIMTNKDGIFDESRDKSLIWTIPQILKSNLISIRNDNEYADYFINRIIFPIRDWKGSLVGFSGRAIDSSAKAKYLISKSSDFFKKEEILFNFSNFEKKKFDEIYLVEGYMDAISLKILGIDNAVATMGVFLSNFSINLIKKFPNISTINLCFDNDEAGNNATIEIGKKLILNGFNVFVVNPFPQNIKDVNDLLVSFSNQECLSMINDQISYEEFLMKLRINNLDNEKEILKGINKFLLEIKDLIGFIPIKSVLKKLANYTKAEIEDINILFEKISKINLPKQEIQQDTRTNNSINMNKANNNYFSNKKNYYSNYFDETNAELKQESKKVLKNLKNFDLIEKNVVGLSVCSYELTSVFFNYYIGTLYFSKNSNDYIFYKKVVSYLTEFYKLSENSQDLNENNFFFNFYNFVNTKNFIEKKELLNRLNKINKKNTHISYEKRKTIVEQGLNLMKDLLFEIINIKKNQLYKNSIKMSIKDRNNLDKELEVLEEKQKRFLSHFEHTIK